MAHVHTLPLSSPHFQYVRTGIKQYELFVNTKKYRRIQVGNIMHFYHATDPVCVPFDATVTEIVTYPSFSAAIEDTPLPQLLPFLFEKEDAEMDETLDEIKIRAVKMYNRHASGDEQKREGVIRFRLKVDLHQFTWKSL